MPKVVASRPGASRLPQGYLGPSPTSEPFSAVCTVCPLLGRVDVILVLWLLSPRIHLRSCGDISDITTVESLYSALDQRGPRRPRERPPSTSGLLLLVQPAAVVFPLLGSTSETSGFGCLRRLAILRSSPRITAPNYRQCKANPGRLGSRLATKDTPSLRTRVILPVLAKRDTRSTLARSL